MVMLEFAPIFICLVMSLLVSLILLGLSFAFNSSTYPEKWSGYRWSASRLLEVDNRVVVPAKTHLRIIVTSADVPHSWAVPSSGVKCDAVPDRVNPISMFASAALAILLFLFNEPFFALAMGGNEKTSSGFPGGLPYGFWREGLGASSSQPPVSSSDLQVASPGLSALTPNYLEELRAVLQDEDEDVLVPEPQFSLREKGIYDRLCRNIDPANFKPITPEIVAEYVQLKEDVISKMAELLPYDSFWSQQKDRLIGEALFNKNGKEYPVSKLKKMIVDLQERGPLSATYRDLLQCQQTFLDSGGRVVRY
jgi:hypothetical protein